MHRVLLAAAIAALSPVAAGAQAFDFEAFPTGFYPTVTLTSGGQTLVVTPEGGGFVAIQTLSVPAPLGTRSAIGTPGAALAGPFVPLRFTFLNPVGTITFLFGDLGGDDDTPARIEAYDGASVLLGTFDTPYPAGFAAGGSSSLVFGGAGAKYFVLSSPAGVGNDHSIYWEVSASTMAAATVPEPATVALTAGGLLALAGIARRRRAR